MEQKILVAYASKYGATREIANKVGEVLSLTGMQIDILPVNDIRDPGAYQAVVLGSAVYVGKWLKEAERFLKTNEKVLAQRPLWLFASGPTGEGDPVELVQGECLPANLKPIVVRIHPRDVALFHGYIDVEKINPIEKFAVRQIVKKPMGDFRDWKAITSWATGIGESLKSAWS